MQRDGIVKRIERVVYPGFKCGRTAKALPNHNNAVKPSGTDTAK
jgi:hypothetical protein